MVSEPIDHDRCRLQLTLSQQTIIPQVTDGVNQPDPLPRTMVPFEYLEANIDLARS
jgi:hypothetical protein